MILTMIPNILSLIRIPLGIAFFWYAGPFRVLITGVTAISDWLDGYLARRWKATSKLGTFLDPIGDKFFALAAFGTLYFEGRLSLPLLLSLFSREGALLLFFIYLRIARKWKDYTVNSFLFGKVMTTCQFVFLLSLTLDYPASPFWFPLFITLGFGSLANLFIKKN